MSKALFTDDFKTDPYWWEHVSAPEPVPIALPARADVVVIGAGYTGLNAALRTARGGRETLVVDAESAGWGCSTRNGGQISTSVKPSYAELRKRVGDDLALRILGEGRDALAWMGEFIAEEGIACDFRVAGRFHAAHNPVQFQNMARAIGQEPKGLETGARLVPRAEQHAELGTDTYHGGVVYPRYAALHPARYHRGLLERVRQAGATVVPHCAATAIRREGEAFEVATALGTVRARDVVVATNGYTKSLTPWLQRRVIPIGSYVIATEALAPGLMDRLMPADRVVSDTRRVVFYYRASPDRSRIVFGGRVSLDETDPRQSGPKLHNDLVGIFPELRDTRISHSWMGFVAYTFDTLAHLGRHDGIHYAMGYCGSGVSMASYLGMRIGQQVLGQAEGRTAFDTVKFQTRPLYTGKPWFLGASIAWYRWLDRQNR